MQHLSITPEAYIDLQQFLFNSYDDTPQSPFFALHCQITKILFSTTDIGHIGQNHNYQNQPTKETLVGL